MNPFFQRASERYRDSEAFLSIVSPEPLRMHFQKPAEEGRLLDRLVIVRGTPGSGKTTMARLLELDVMDALRRHRAPAEHKDVFAALNDCGFMEAGVPRVAAVRLPLESEYRQYWELPYDSHIKARLLMRLLQARAVLKWVRLLRQGASVGADIQVIMAKDASATATAIGGPSLEALRQRAAEVERAVHSIGAALLPPHEDQFPEAANSPYSPFDVIAGFQRFVESRRVVLQPLVILDDVHELHQAQLASLQRDLARREIPVARWMLTRLDALPPDEALEPVTDSSASGLDKSREVTRISLQQRSRGAKTSGGYKRLASQMADRYLQRIDMFSSRNLRRFDSLVASDVPPLSDVKLERLRETVARTQTGLAVADARAAALAQAVAEFLEARPVRGAGEDVALAMTSILMHRFAKRTPQTNLFEEDRDDDLSKEPVPNSGVLRGAEMHLLHAFERPVYFGFDAIRDASWENAELFLHLAGRLVELSEAQIVQQKAPALSAEVQHRQLRAKASEIVAEWGFPFAQEVRTLTSLLAEECLRKTLEPNAPLGAGAGAVGIPESEFVDIGSRRPFLARVLHYGVAYNAFTAIRNYSQGERGKRWCLIELGGVVRLAHGLTLARGGFIERNLNHLETTLHREPSQ